MYSLSLLNREAISITGFVLPYSSQSLGIKRLPYRLLHQIRGLLQNHLLELKKLIYNNSNKDNLSPSLHIKILYNFYM